MAPATPDVAYRSMVREGPPSQGRKVRVVAKVRSPTDLEVLPGKQAPAPWISVSKSNGEASDSVTVTLGEQSASSKECFEIGYCYEATEGNEMIFERDVKPLLSGVFNGHNATVVACGARGSGKTHLVQGTNGESGLTLLSMAEILRLAEEKNMSVTISYFEILQERAQDLLEPKAEEVLVLKDGQGRVQLKGLSCVQVKSLTEFHKIYSARNRTVRKLNQKINTSLPSRSTKGLVVYISSRGENLARAPAGKINFVELAGYEDAKRASNASNFGENAQINKSIHALFKVVYSLHANETYVSYRESKLSRMLEDSLGGKSRILIVTCLNPVSCQDSVNMLNLASRCCQSTTRVVSDSARKTNSTARSKVLASRTSRMRGAGSVSSMRKQPTPSHLPTPGKKAGGNASALKARKLFEDKGHEESEKISKCAAVSVTESSTLEEDCSSSIGLTAASFAQEEEKSTLNASKEIMLPENSSMNLDDVHSVLLEEVSSTTVFATCTSTSVEEVTIEHSEEDDPVVITPATKALSVVEEGRSLDNKENEKCLVNDGESPPISSQLQEISNTLKQLESPPISLRLQEISNTLKQLFTSTPSYDAIPSSQDQTSTPYMGLSTPAHNTRVNNASEASDVAMVLQPSNDPAVQQSSLQDQTSTPSMGPSTPAHNTKANNASDIDMMLHSSNDSPLQDRISTFPEEPRTPECYATRGASSTLDIASFCSPWEKLNRSNCGVKNSLVQEYLSFINTANKEDLKKLKGIGEKRATYIMELREDSPFKDLDELKDVGLSAKQIKDMVGKDVLGGLFT